MTGVTDTNSGEEDKINAFIQQNGVTVLPEGKAEGTEWVRSHAGPAGGNGTKTTGRSSERGALGKSHTYEEKLIKQISSKIKLEKRHKDEP